MARIVITGANRGIGLELAKQRAQFDEVIALCRKASDELRAIDVKVVEGIDVTDDEAVNGVAARLSEVDILVNNAGFLRSEQLDSLDWDDIQKQMEVNAYGPLRVSAAIAPKIVHGGRIAIITSRMGSLADNTSGGSYGYRMSKAAVNMVGVGLARDLADREISVALIHPGYVRTEMTKKHGNVNPDEAAAMIWERVDELDMENTGTFWHANGETLPW